MDVFSRPTGPRDAEPSHFDDNDSDPGKLEIDLDYSSPSRSQSTLSACSPVDFVRLEQDMSNSGDQVDEPDVSSDPQTPLDLSKSAFQERGSSTSQSLQRSHLILGSGHEFEDDLQSGGKARCLVSKPPAESLASGLVEFRTIIAERNIQLILTGGQRYIMGKCYSGLVTDVFFPEREFQTLPEDTASWHEVEYRAVSSMDYKFAFRSPNGEVTVMVKCPDTLEAVLSLITENKPFMLSPDFLHDLAEQFIQKSGTPFILYAEHEKAKILLGVEITHWGLFYRKLFSYIHYINDTICENDRSTIKKDLVVVLHNAGKDSTCSTKEEQAIFEHSKGEITCYRQMLFEYVQKIQAQTQGLAQRKAFEFPLNYSFKPNVTEKHIKCAFCELRYPEDSDLYFAHLGRFHLGPLLEPITCFSSGCGYQILDQVEHVKHIYYTHGNISIKALSQCFDSTKRSKVGITESPLEPDQPCPICQKLYKTKTQLETHFVIIHCLHEILFHIPQKQSLTDKLLCPRIGCLEVFNDVWGLAVHFGTKHDLIREALKPLSNEVWKRCPLKSCSDQTLANELAGASVHLKSHSANFLQNEIASLQEALGVNANECPLLECKFRTHENIVRHFHQSHKGIFSWLSSLPMEKMTGTLEILKAWKRVFSTGGHIYVCPLCVFIFHSAKYFSNKTTLLFHLFEAHFKEELENKYRYNCLLNTSDYALCVTCKSGVRKNLWVVHQSVVHGGAIHMIAPIFYGELGQDIKQVVLNLKSSGGSASAKSPPNMVLIENPSPQQPSSSQPSAPRINFPPPTNLPQGSKPAKLRKVLPKPKFSLRYGPKMKPQNACGNPMENMPLNTAENNAASMLEQLQQERKLPPQLKVPHLPSSMPSFDFSRPPLSDLIPTNSKPFPPMSYQGSEMTASQTSFDQTPRFSMTPLAPGPSQMIKVETMDKNSAAMITCLQCRTGFKDLHDFLAHIGNDENHDNASALCRFCEMQFPLGAKGSLARYFELHSYSRTHLYNQWVIEQNMRKTKWEKCYPRRRSGSISILNRCDVCMEFVPDLETHLKSSLHENNVHVIKEFLRYCEIKAICPVICPPQNVNHFLSLIHLEIISIPISIEEVLVILSRIHDPIGADELHHCQEIRHYLQNLERNDKFFKFACRLCLILTHNAQDIADHCQTLLHKTRLLNCNNLNRHLISVFQCLVCPSVFKDHLDFRLHVFTRNHLIKESQGQFPSTQAPKPIVMPFSFCSLCQTLVVQNDHLTNPYHVKNERYAMSYLEWCRTWDKNPVTCCTNSIESYLQHLFRTASAEIFCCEALLIVDRIHEDQIYHKLLAIASEFDKAKATMKTNQTQGCTVEILKQLQDLSSQNHLINPMKNGYRSMKPNASSFAANANDLDDPLTNKEFILGVNRELENLDPADSELSSREGHQIRNDSPSNVCQTSSSPCIGNGMKIDWVKLLRDAIEQNTNDSDSKRLRYQDDSLPQPSTNPETCSSPKRS